MSGTYAVMQDRDEAAEAAINAIWSGRREIIPCISHTTGFRPDGGYPDRVARYRAVKFSHIYQANHGHDGVCGTMYHEPIPNTSGPGPSHSINIHVVLINADANPEVAWFDELKSEDGAYLRSRGFSATTPRGDLDRHYSRGTVCIDRLAWEERLTSAEVDSFGWIASDDDHVPLDEACRRLEVLSWAAFRPILDGYLTDHRRREYERLAAELPKARERVSELEAVMAAGVDSVVLDWEGDR